MSLMLGLLTRIEFYPGATGERVSSRTVYVFSSYLNIIIIILKLTTPVSTFSGCIFRTDHSVGASRTDDDVVAPVRMGFVTSDSGTLSTYRTILICFFLPLYFMRVQSLRGTLKSSCVYSTYYIIVYRYTLQAQAVA